MNDNPAPALDALFVFFAEFAESVRHDGFKDGYAVARDLTEAEAADAQARDMESGIKAIRKAMHASEAICDMRPATLLDLAVQLRFLGWLAETRSWEGGPDDQEKWLIANLANGMQRLMR